MKTMSERFSEKVDKANDKTVFTYFIQGDPYTPVKIGKASNPTKRLEMLQVGSPRRLRILGVIEGDIEKKLHKRFENLRLRGEWFEWSIEIEACIRWEAIENVSEMYGQDYYVKVAQLDHLRHLQEIYECSNELFRNKNLEDDLDCAEFIHMIKQIIFGTKNTYEGREFYEGDFPFHQETKFLVEKVLSAMDLISKDEQRS